MLGYTALEAVLPKIKYNLSKNVARNLFLPKPKRYLKKVIEQHTVYVISCLYQVL